MTCAAKKAAALGLSALFLLCFAVSCGDEDYDYSGDDVPDMSLVNAVYVISEPDQEPIRLKADRMDIFTRQNVIEMTGAEFSQGLADGDGENIRGAAGRIRLDTKSQDASLSGGVEIYMHSEEGNENKIVAENLEWGKYSKMIKSDGNVFLQYEKSAITGVGFAGNMATAQFTFDSITDGRI